MGTSQEVVRILLTAPGYVNPYVKFFLKQG